MAASVIQEQLENIVRTLPIDDVEVTLVHPGQPMCALFPKGLKFNSTRLIRGGESQNPFIGGRALIGVKDLRARGPYKKGTGRSAVTSQAVVGTALAKLAA